MQSRGYRKPGQWQEVRGMWAWLRQRGQPPPLTLDPAERQATRGRGGDTVLGLGGVAGRMEVAGVGRWTWGGWRT